MQQDMCSMRGGKRSSLHRWIVSPKSQLQRKKTQNAAQEMAVESSREQQSTPPSQGGKKSHAVHLKGYSTSLTSSSRKSRLHALQQRTQASKEPDAAIGGLERSETSLSWPEDASTIVPPASMPRTPPQSYTLKLPDAVTSAPSLMVLTRDELSSRGIYTPRLTFELAQPRPSTSYARPSTSRSMSFRSALSTFVPHPGVVPLLFEEPFEEPGQPASSRQDFPTGLPLALIILGICLSVFIISLDRGIVTTAIPSIVSDFRQYSHIGWYGSAYLLTASAFQPLYGRIYTSFDVKWSFLGAVAMFEVGSLFCSVAPTSMALIVGRAVQGLGSAGILTGSFVVGTHIVKLSRRPMLFAFVGVLYGAGSLTGPLLGGVFSQLTTWRWCFYLNLPIGAMTFLSVLLCFRPHAAHSGSPSLVRQPSKLSSMGESIFRRLRALDWIGNALFTTACTFLFLALQWSQERSSDWSSSRCIAAISISGFTFCAFILWLSYKGDEALIPLHILKQRTVAVSCASAFFIYGALLIHTYYLPIWFQAIKNKTAINSGVGMVPYLLTNAFFSLAAGIFVSRNGYFAPPAIVGCAIGTIGSGLLATLRTDSNTTTWAGFEFLVSAGLGMAIQQGFSAVQASLPLHEVPIGTAAVVACQSAGGAIFVSVGNTLLQNHLFVADRSGVIPGVNIRAVVEIGATNFRKVVPAESLPALISLYNDALQAVFVAAVPLCGIAFLCSLGMEWKSVRVDENSSRPSSIDPERGRRNLETPELGSDASTLAHLAPRARQKWSQRWKAPRDETRPPVPPLSTVLELNIDEKTLMPFEASVRDEGVLSDDIKKPEIGQAITM